MESIYPVILSGGSGTRLWPLSREHYPKQLLAMTGAGKYSLLQATQLRTQGIENCLPPTVVCNEEHRFLVAEQLREIGCKPVSILLESSGRNTAPALTLAALTLQQPESVMLVMPADHVIQDTAAFQQAVVKGAKLALQGRLVTFGIVPNSPETGYGYIRKGAPITDQAAYLVERFVEKPDADTAESYLRSGDYLWNSGMFIMTASQWLQEIKQYRPDIFRKVQASAQNLVKDLDFSRVSKSEFDTCPSESIDYAVMEKTDKAVVLQLDAGWSDIGAWSAYWQISDKDTKGNSVSGDVLLQSCQNNLVIAQHRLVAAVGVDDLVIVETPDAVLVANRGCAQQVKDVVAELKKQKRTEHIVHRKVYRPWGSYEGVDTGERFQVKRITVNPGAALSLQMHHHRAEHWIVVKGTARVTRDAESFIITENQSTFIPLGIKHRLENPGSVPLEIIEVQSGSYLGEDDIVRYEDRYHRE